MANNNTNSAYSLPEKPKKLLLAKLFTDAQVRKEPEEKQKTIVAGLVEAHPQKDYPNTNLPSSLREARLCKRDF